ncbi:MAG: hypothetical protein R3D89_04910 [Sphingomonadaceae bacterium]
MSTSSPCAICAIPTSSERWHSARCNAKTAAAAREAGPIVAVNALAVLDGKEPVADYDGYGSCPLTVERGKIVLAEFGYDGKLLPSFPSWLIDGTRPRKLSWLLKSELLPWIYWNPAQGPRVWRLSRAKAAPCGRSRGKPGESPGRAGPLLPDP